MRNGLPEFSLPDPKGRKAVFRRALVDSLPVFMGYETMGLVAGVLLAAKGNLLLSPLWAFLTSAFWVTGTISIAGVPLIAARVSAWSFALMTLMVNFRYAFYGFSMLERWRGISVWRKLYLILMLTDENFALEYACKIEDRRENVRYCTYLSALNQFYWVSGLTAGAIMVWCLGHVVNPETIRHWTNGMEFSMAALFLVILTDQVRGMMSHAK